MSDTNAAGGVADEAARSKQQQDAAAAAAAEAPPQAAGEDAEPPAAAAADTPADTAAAAPDELEPQLKYERLGADVKAILRGATATALALSEKVIALGSSAGNIHVLDYSGNEVRRRCRRARLRCAVRPNSVVSTRAASRIIRCACGVAASHSCCCLTTAFPVAAAACPAR